MKKEFNGFSGLQEYLQQQLKIATAGKEPMFAEKTLSESLLQMLNETKSKYSQLVQRIEAETQNNIEKYAIRMIVVDKADYNPINPTWFPVMETETQPFLLKEKELRAAIDENKAIAIKHVFIAASDEKCRKILYDSQSLSGVIETDQGKIPALFSLTKSILYRKEIFNLYRLFHANKIPWITLNTAYLDKFFLLKLDYLSGVVPEGAQWLDIQVDYGVYSGIIDEDKIPLWNVQSFVYNCDTFPVPCIDSINYEHELVIDDCDRYNGFLIEPCEEITDIRYEINDSYDNCCVVLVTPKESFAKWKARKIIIDPPKKSLGYDLPVISNETHNGLAFRHVCKQLKTKAQLTQIINDLKIEQFIRFTGCELIEIQDPYPDLEDMNWFIQSEVFDQRNRRVLNLTFEAFQPDHYLNDAMVRFVTSFIQLFVSEYRCIGILVK